MPCSSSADVTLPVSAGSSDATSIVYDGAEASRSMKKRTNTTASAPMPSTSLERVGICMMVWANVGIWASDLGVEDVLGGFDQLGADLRRELHRELRTLDGHDDGGRILGRAGGERAGALGRFGLRLAERLERLAEHAAEAGAAVARP